MLNHEYGILILPSDNFDEFVVCAPPGICISKREFFPWISTLRFVQQSRSMVKDPIGEMEENAALILKMEILKRTFNNPQGTSNQDLEDFMKQHPSIPFNGCCAKDTIPQMDKSLDWAMIVNMSDETNGKGVPLPGTHWVVIGCKDKDSFYFDSFGLPPPMDVIRYFKTDSMIQSRKEIQSKESRNCGWYSVACILYLFSHKETVEKMLNAFVDLFNHRNYQANDQILYNLLTYFVLMGTNPTFSNVSVSFIVAVSGTTRFNERKTSLMAG